MIASWWFLLGACALLVAAVGVLRREADRVRRHADASIAEMIGRLQTARAQRDELAKELAAAKETLLGREKELTVARGEWVQAERRAERLLRTTEEELRELKLDLRAVQNMTVYTCPAGNSFELEAEPEHVGPQPRNLRTLAARLTVWVGEVRDTPVPSHTLAAALLERSGMVGCLARLIEKERAV